MSSQERKDISVLYVEDEPLAREAVVEILQRRVREVFTADNGSEGLAMFREHKPDLVVTDIRMPLMDGLKMTREIRLESKGALIIVTTAHSDTSYMLDAIDLGVDQYVVKPVNVEKLTTAVNKCAEIIEYRRAHKRHLEEREKLITDLQEALAKVKQLSGFLPICASCKKIRDDEGYWQQIESYIRDHSEAEFSHGICPDCAKRLYGDYLKKAEKL